MLYSILFYSTTGTLVLAVDAVLALPERSALLREPIAEAKLRFQMQRDWVSILAALNADSLSEASAAAAQRLLVLRGVVDAELGTGLPPVGVATAQALHAHYSALQHMLQLWAIGRPLPGDLTIQMED